MFVEVGRLGSFSEAAQALHITQPAVSYQIRRIEEEFGTSLLRRRHRGVELTDAGSELMALLSPCVARLDHLAARLREAPRPQVLRVITDYAFSSLWLIPRIHLFRAAHPDLDIEVVASQHSDVRRLREGEIAVVFGRRDELPEEARLLFPEVVVPVCAPGLLVGAEPAADARLIHLDSGTPAPWFSWADYLAQNAGARAAQAERGHLRFNTYSLVMDAAVAGQGVALGWRGLVDSLIGRGQLVVAGREMVARERGYYLLPGPRPDPQRPDPERLEPATQLLRRWLLDLALEGEGGGR